ncbi:hypothetical protein FBZ93_118147 [Bradyrhizobium macuxiense]|uniref:Uncharacterized protein n=1 Tax=Bradyrhizobium macuxiense TaxID=1755647 RepID=A0A560KZI0_9BRAD|nr:hypothetical protein FBZ93_118147 [Bradyrhizobium macuxiense]
MHSAFAAVGLIVLAMSFPAHAQQSPSTAVDQLLQWTIEDVARQRTRAREQDEEEHVRRKLPDLSQYGVPFRTPTRPADRSSRALHCTTIDMGGGDSVTDCF